MKKKYIMMSMLLAATVMIPCRANAADDVVENSTTAYSSSVEYAYSIGHDFGMNIPFVEDYAGDCTISVTHASTIYGMLGYTSYYSYNPTYTYLRGQNPAGVDRLGSSIVYVDGHANYDNIICGDTVDDSEHKCGIYYLSDITSSKTGYTYAGLNDRDLSGVKLFTFVGCNTAANNENLCTSAENGGVTCVVGFSDTINGLTDEGQNWKKSYNNSLGNGSTVEEAITNATTNYPNCNLGDCVQTYGDASINIALNSSRTALITDPFMHILKTTDAKFDFSSVENSVYIPLDKVKNEYADLIQILSKNNPRFDTSQYKALANGFAGDTGIIKVRYYVDDIETSSVLVFSVVDGEIVNYSDYYDDTLENTGHRGELLASKKAFEQKEFDVRTAETKQVESEYNVESQTGRYYYDFSDATLYYITDVVYSVPGSNACGMSEVRTPVKTFQITNP